ncbi:S1 RNA-binding domain-containing protein 1-like [Acipenser ruthenus]|uniref:S1 RNA-binding domain-containing protein 1-like n=1 Tax=Acipenser ruthenus TaxID=7906 RepID=UPI00274256A1|nr:S1 RNA-binding domain-containing protein 1-like [Acipenser ruthenus]
MCRWDLIQVLSERTVVDPWVCANLVNLFKEENIIPFIVRYRKELSNHMDVDAVRDVQLAVEELRNVAKKVHAVIQTLKKEGTLTISLEKALLNCRSADELDHVILAINRGENLKILTVEVNIPDRVKNEFIRWCLNSMNHNTDPGEFDFHMRSDSFCGNSYKSPSLRWVQ